MSYICTKCQNQSLKWEGKCSSCGAWGSVEEVDESAGSGALKGSSFGNGGEKKSDKKKSGNSNLVNKYFCIKDIMGEEESEEVGDRGLEVKSEKLKVVSGRVSTEIGELDRVLGGGLVKGEVVLMSGQPGIGKSTLLLQVAINLTSNGKVLYFSGEESPAQILGRLQRIGVEKDKLKMVKENLILSAESCVENMAEVIEDIKPAIVIVDSIQTVFTQSVKSFAGNISQIRVCGGMLTFVAKQLGIPFFIVGQINKEGSIAGPKILEHTVDCVLYVEGDEFNYYRVLRSIKNRYGATNEIGVFEMQGSGMIEVPNPSQIFLEQDENVPGCAISAVLKGSRVVFVEIQALTIDREVEGVPLRRVANGVKKPKLDMLCAVLSRRGGVFLGNKDVFVNVAGGLNLDDPSIDLAICMAIKSAVEDMPLGKNSVYVGEVGLSGNVRSVMGVDAVIKEAKRLGYEKIVSGQTKSKTGSEKDKAVKVIKNLREI